jgi:hypothetical protein
MTIRLALAFLRFAPIVLASAACGGTAPPLPKGPPPEYEQEPGPTTTVTDAAAPVSEQ